MGKVNPSSITRATKKFCIEKIKQGLNQLEVAKLHGISKQSLINHLSAEDTNFTTLKSQFKSQSQVKGSKTQTKDEIFDKLLDDTLKEKALETDTLDNNSLYLKKIIEIRNILKKENLNCSNKDAIAIYEITKSEVTGSVLPYINLDPQHDLILGNSRQRDMYCSTIKGKHTITVGIRGTSKTTFTKNAIGKLAVTIPNLQIHHFCGKVDTSTANLKEIKEWLYDRKLPNSYITISNAHSIEFVNGSYIRAHANTQADIRKYRGKVNWVDEAQLLSKPAMAALLGLFSGVEDFQLILTGNFGEITGSPFENFCRAENKKEICEDLNIDYYEFDESDISWTSAKSKLGLRKLMDATIGVDGTATQLDPVWVTPEGAIYDVTWINKAYTPVEFPKQMIDVIGGADWGDGSETTLPVIGLGVDNHLYLLHSWAKRNAQTKDVKRVILWCESALGCKKWHWEGSPSGDYARKEIVEEYGDRIAFTNSYFSSHKERFIFNIHRLLGSGMIHFIDKVRVESNDLDDLPYTKQDYINLRILRQELERYCGDKKMDHIHDGMAHPIDKLVSEKGLIGIIEKAFNNKVLIKQYE